jgi:hypothetical protein
VYQNNEMAAILVYGTGISSFLFKYFVLFHHPTGATDHVSENDLYIKNNIPYTERKDLVPDNLEMTCVEITRQHSKPLLISTWYRPPNSELDIFTNFELFLFKCDISLRGSKLRR